MISIVIPAYNAEKTIARCLESIFKQSYQDYEVMVVNDGSTDATEKVVLDFTRTVKEKYPSSEAQRNREVLHLIMQENRGAQAARNRGARTAKGEYLLFCDADIVLRRDCLEKMMCALADHSEASYAYSSFKFGWKKFKLWPFDTKRLRRMPYIHTTSLIRAAHFPGFDESVRRLQDWDLWLTMLEQGHIGVWVPEVLFKVISMKGTMSQWLPSFAYKIPKWLGIQPKAVARYNEAVARIKAKHKLG